MSPDVQGSCYSFARVHIVSSWKSASCVQEASIKEAGGEAAYHNGRTDFVNDLAGAQPVATVGRDRQGEAGGSLAPGPLGQLSHGDAKSLR